MRIEAAEATLAQLPINRIDRNSDNPRLVFRPAELETLVESIRRHGVQVPISVYKEGRRYVLIDGERRWRSSLKLNKKTIPALVQPKPDRLTNLVLMFNIHALREQWDLLTIAIKLPTTIELLEKSLGHQPTEREIAETIGIPRSTIRRSKLLVALPQEYRDLILDELKKPKSQQKLTEDFFIEMEKALSVIEKRLPEVFPKGDRDRARRVLIKKYRDGVIENIVHFRDLAKIARAAEVVSADQAAAARELKRVFQSDDYSIENAYDNSVEEAYLERDLGTRVSTLIRLLGELRAESLDEPLWAALRELYQKLNALFGQ